MMNRSISIARISQKLAGPAVHAYAAQPSKGAHHDVLYTF